MPLPVVLDLDTLLRPIGESTPSGVDPRDDSSVQSPYYRVRDARTAARAAERSNVDPNAPPPDAWANVLAAGQELLSRDAKDLEIAAWLVEALVRMEGFAGLRDGLRLLAGLADGFWDTVHPLPDEDGVEGRVVPVAALSGAGAAGTLAQTLRTLPLVGIARPYSLWDYERAVELEKLTDPVRKEARIADGTPSLEMFRESLTETAGRDLYSTLETVEGALEELAGLGRVMDERAGNDAPSFGALRDLLAHIASSIRHFGAEKIAAVAKAAETGVRPVEASAADVDTDPASVGMRERSEVQAAPRTGGFADREEALEAVLRLSEHFRRTEPQAPISYTLAEAVRRARMPLPDLLRELASDAAHIHRFMLASGMRLEGDVEVRHEQSTTFQPAAHPVSSRNGTGGDGW